MTPPQQGALGAPMAPHTTQSPAGRSSEPGSVAASAPGAGDESPTRRCASVIVKTGVKFPVNVGPSRTGGLRAVEPAASTSPRAAGPTTMGIWNVGAQTAGTPTHVIQTCVGIQTCVAPPRGVPR